MFHFKRLFALLAVIASAGTLASAQIAAVCAYDAPLIASEIIKDNNENSIDSQYAEIAIQCGDAVQLQRFLPGN